MKTTPEKSAIYTGSNERQNKNTQTDNYQALFEQATDAIMVLDFNGNLIDMNPGFCAMFGFTKEELLGLNVNSLLHLDDLMLQPIRFDLLEAGRNIIIERQMIHKDGSIICVESNEKKFTDHHVLIIARNITERKITEGILQKSEANLQAIFNTTDTIYVLMNKELEVISYNPRAREFVGKELGHTIKMGDYFVDYFPVAERPEFLNYMQDVLDGKNIHYEIDYPQQGKHSHWYHLRLFPITNGQNKVYGVMMALSDITEKTVLEQKLEEERRKKQDEITDAVITAEENERHEIGIELHDNVNQLLAAARLYLGMGKSREKKDAQFFFDKADNFIDTAINEIRNLSHSLISPFLEEYGLLKAIDHLTEAISKSTTLSIEKSINMDENLVPHKLKLTLYRIIQEQLTNILKHAQATTVTIKTDQDNDHIILHIKDDGVGFDTTKASTGIGLMNIRTRASLNNGKVDIISSPGKGADLIVSFKTETE